MNSEDFIKWLKGFSEGVHHFNLSPKQWDFLKSKLKKVNPNQTQEYIIDSNYWETSTTW